MCVGVLYRAILTFVAKISRVLLALHFYAREARARTFTFTHTSAYESSQIWIHPRTTCIGGVKMGKRVASLYVIVRYVLQIKEEGENFCVIFTTFRDRSDCEFQREADAVNA